MFDYDRFARLKSLIKSGQFVPMDAASAGAGGMPPDAGGMPPDAGGMPPDAGGMPPDAGGMPPPGMDPAAMGGMPPGMDPAAMGGMPPPGMDPAAMGGMPPPGMDPAAMGGMPPPDAGGEVSPTGEPYMKITPTQLSKLFKQFAEVFKSVLGIQQPGPSGAIAGLSTSSAPTPDPGLQNKLTEVDAKLDALIGGLQG